MFRQVFASDVWIPVYRTLWARAPDPKRAANKKTEKYFGRYIYDIHSDFWIDSLSGVDGIRTPDCGVAAGVWRRCEKEVGTSSMTAVQGALAGSPLVISKTAFKATLEGIVPLAWRPPKGTSTSG